MVNLNSVHRAASSYCKVESFPVANQVAVISDSTRWPLSSIEDNNEWNDSIGTSEARSGAHISAQMDSTD
jgi:hypothetical protein